MSLRLTIDVIVLSVPALYESLMIWIIDLSFMLSPVPYLITLTEVSVPYDIDMTESLLDLNQEVLETEERLLGDLCPI